MICTFFPFLLEWDIGLIENKCSNETNQPRANKRFLTSIIKSTDEHNRNQLRAQAEGAEKKWEGDRWDERRGSSKRSGRERSRSRSRDHHKSRKRKRRDEDEDEKDEFGGLEWDRWDPRSDPVAKRDTKERDWENWEGEHRRTSRRTHRHHHHKHRRRRTPSPWSRRLLGASKLLRSPSPDPDPEPRAARPPPPSKMDRYFAPDYDPRLDVEHITVPTIPTNGLISDADFAGWDAMLDALRAREDRKKMGSAGAGVGAGITVDKGLLDVKYVKKGVVREWDVGKEVPT